MLIFATHNHNKLREVAPFFEGLAELRLPEEYGIKDALPEDFDTLEANAQQKCEFVYAATGIDCFADDTGLEVEILDGAPGAFSARYAGPDCRAEDNINKLLAALEGKSNRRAHFRTVIALIYKGSRYNFEGRVDGEILESRRGNGGFGYDPIFRPDGYQETFAEMDRAQKNTLSHRGRAIAALVEFLKSQKI